MSRFIAGKVYQLIYHGGGDRMIFIIMEDKQLEILHDSAKDEYNWTGLLGHYDDDKIYVPKDSIMINCRNIKKLSIKRDEIDDYLMLENI